MKPILQDDFYQYSYLSNIKISPDGKKTAYVCKKINEKNNNYDSYIYLLKDDNNIMLTTGGKEGFFIWEDNENLLFTTKRGEDLKRSEEGEVFTSFYRINVNGGEASKIFEIPVSIGNVKLLDDGRMLISVEFNKKYPDFYKMNEEERKEVIKEIKDNKDYEEVDESPFYFNGEGFTNGNRNGLFLYDKTDNKLEKISEGIYTVYDYQVMGNKVIYFGNCYDRLSSFTCSLKSYDLETKETKTLIEEGEYGIYNIRNLEGKLVIWMTDMKEYGLNQNSSVYLYDLGTDKYEKIIDEVLQGNSTGTDCRLGGGEDLIVVGDTIYSVETIRNSAKLVSYTNGTMNYVIDCEGSIDSFDIRNNKIVYNYIGANCPQELYEYDLETKKTKALTNFHDEIFKDRYVALPDKLTIKSCNTDIDGWVLKPIDYDENKKYPAILDIHGGPKTVYGEIYYHEMQIWASKGYFVFFCNPIGGDGRGNEFADICGKYGTIDYQNIMDFTDEVLKKYPNIDQKKVCVTGGSYGGFMTNWIVGHTGRFVAAATQRSISNWISFMGTSDIGFDFTQDQNRANLDNIEKLWEHSPLKYVDNVKTPTLFIHSDEDYRCPLEQGIQFYSAIARKGIDTKMVIFHGGNHELSRGGKPLHRSKRLKEITEWFDKYTKGNQ